MLLTPEQLERACGFLLLNEFNVFSYCCKSCTSEFDSGTELETHVLLEHQDTKSGFEDVFESLNDDFDSDEPWNDTDQQLMTVDEIKQEIVVEPTVLHSHETRTRRQAATNIGILGVFINDSYDHGIVKNEPSETNAIETNDTKVNTERTKKKPQPTTAKTKTNTPQNPLQLNPNKYYCDMCPFDKVKFNRKKQLYQHIRDHVVARKPCPICKAIPPYLPTHMKKYHPGIDPYKCNFCEKKYKMESALTKHLRTHTGERPYMCSTCGDAFKTSNALHVHTERIHASGKKWPYSCTDCTDLQFRLVSQFEKHRLAVHNDERCHVCTICGDRFKTHTSLREHKFIHGEKTFACKHCGKKFKTTGVKRFHERKVHEEVNWKKKKNNRTQKNTVVNEEGNLDQADWNPQGTTTEEDYLWNF